MPDLDQLLADDARLLDASDTTIDTSETSFHAAYDQALTTSRRRHLRVAGTASVAGLAIVGGLVFAALSGNNSDAHRPTVHLAAYDQVLGAVPNDEGSVYVIGPKDEHTAACDVITDVEVERTPVDPSSNGHAFAIAIKGNLPDGFLRNHYPPSLIALRDPNTPLFVFSCPMS